MLNNIIKYTALACTVSVIALSANADTFTNQARQSETIQSWRGAQPTESAPMVVRGTAAPIKIEVKEQKQDSKKAHHKERLEYTESVAEKQDTQKAAGRNFFMIKGGVAGPVNKLGDTTDLNKPKATFTVGALIGREFMDNSFALDLEYMHRANSHAYLAESSGESSGYTSWKLRSEAVMANLKFNLVKNSAITPYLRAGVGLSSNHAGTNVTVGTALSDYYPGKTRNQFAWQAGLGFNFTYNSMFSTVLEYMYVDHGKFSTQSSKTTVVTDGTTTAAAAPISGKLKDHVITFGIKVNF